MKLPRQPFPWNGQSPRPVIHAMEKSRRRLNAGMTLVEVMLALTILGIATAGLLHSASRCIAVIRKSKHYETARQLMGRVELESPLLLEEEIEEGSEDGTFEGGPDGYTWRRIIETVGEEEYGLFKVTTRILWSSRGRDAYEEAVSYLYREFEE